MGQGAGEGGWLGRVGGGLVYRQRCPVCCKALGGAEPGWGGGSSVAGTERLEGKVHRCARSTRVSRFWHS